MVFLVLPQAAALYSSAQNRHAAQQQGSRQCPMITIANTSTTKQLSGVAYKVYGGGIMRASDALNSKIQILIPLESVVIFN